MILLRVFLDESNADIRFQSKMSEQHVHRQHECYGFSEYETRSKKKGEMAHIFLHIPVVVVVIIKRQM